ncbi:type II toxin-antitoxin system HicB family antitoxin [Candidatus Enterococcus clewellii]|uniref:HicB-like antitoxin of toxin-antitoxin system domain-containing protein n=1 Tax=Candidatus Enterococcus clewellii TaxID=1834193 RepID=A0A242KE43_9ENTE|nr:type II toxin-antitoxin system HicB family antitoxin [Enterococcus sp. 9E7_DIV0242]OTP19422.1 hypothetical protein A5888_001239 [Enterococcus sp. 9E7_DIV0242]
MLVSYPALFYYDDTEETNAKFFVSFPDFPGYAGTQGEDIPDAMYMSADWLGIVLADAIENGREIVTPTPINKLSLVGNNPFKDDEEMRLVYDPENSFISMVTVDVSKYLGNQEPIKKTLTIPKWADKLGREMHLNFSKTLTDAIADKKMNV